MDLPSPCTWVFVGDSITQASHWTHGARGWVELVSERVRYELDRPLDVVVNTGVSGWTTDDAVAHLDRALTRWRGDVVSISLGTNDASTLHRGVAGPVPLPRFLGNLRTLVAAAGAAQVVLHTPVLRLPVEDRRPDLATYGQAVRDLAAETGAVLVDHEAVWRERFGDDPSPVMADPLHPGPEGHRLMAHTFLAALGLD